MAKKESERLAVMVPRECKTDIDYIISQTGIRTNGELVKLLLARYKDDFINAYNAFFSPSNAIAVQPHNPPVEVESAKPPAPALTKPLTSAMEF